jgi:LmbE family N-acetylglucosaminyl deacetylase
MLRILALFLSCLMLLQAASAKELRPLTARDRVLLLAPHPDDESLGGAALLQRAIAAKAAVRVIFATNGEGNPWPQRLLERRLVLTPEDRKRWGYRRQREGIAALKTLGVQAGDARFLNWPDLGVTDLLIRGNQDALRQLSRIIAEFQPNIVAIPSPADRHPDHSACHVLARLALARAGLKNARLIELDYLVHGKPAPETAHTRFIRLTPLEQQTKRSAILQHTSQTAISRKALLSFARKRETFTTPAPSRYSTDHPVREAMLKNGHLNVRVSNQSQAPLYLIADRGSHGILVQARRPKKRQAEFPLKALPLKQLFIKQMRRGFFLDGAGWRELPVD